MKKESETVFMKPKFIKYIRILNVWVISKNKNRIFLTKFKNQLK